MKRHTVGCKGACAPCPLSLIAEYVGSEYLHFLAFSPDAGVNGQLPAQKHQTACQATIASEGPAFEQQL